jgi:hypothetical protein
MMHDVFNKAQAYVLFGFLEPDSRATKKLIKATESSERMQV